MKKIILLAVLVILGYCSSLFAQQTSTTANTNSNSKSASSPAKTSKFKESEYYYFNIPIEKIFSYRSGFVVLYRKGVNQMARTYLPAEWFSDTGGKGAMVALGSGSEWPSMTVYYKKGVFSHVRLLLRQSRAHETWGVVPLDVNLDEYFKGVEDVKLEF